MRNSTITKHLSFLKWFLRWSLKKRYNTNNTFEYYKPKLKTTDKKVIFLNWDELTQLREYEIPSSKQYLNKYKDVHFEDNKALPVISNQKMNDYLKELGKLAEIDESIRETYYKGNERIDKVRPKHELLGTHAGRRTFICNSLAMGIPAQTVMKWTGHSDYKAMKPYIDIADKTKQEAMNLWNEQEDKKETELLDQLKDLSRDDLKKLLSKLN